MSFFGNNDSATYSGTRLERIAKINEEDEESFNSFIKEHLSRADIPTSAEIVVGVPFYNEVDTIEEVLKTAEKGLEKYFPNEKCVIVAIGSPAGKEALKLINGLPQSSKIGRIAFLLDNESLDGKGWHIRAIMEIARILGADLAILEADQRNQTDDEGIKGLIPDWINLLLKPIRQDRLDLVISRFNRHWFESPISAHVVYPLLTAIYNSPIYDLVGAQWGISHRLLRVYLQRHYSARSTEAMEYGIDIWLATVAITSGARIGEASLGSKITIPSSIAKMEIVLRQITTVLFDQIATDKDWWKTPDRAEILLFQPLPIYGSKTRYEPPELLARPHQLTAKYRQDLVRFNSLYQAVLPQEIFKQLKNISKAGITTFDFNAKLWARIVYHFLLAFAFLTGSFARNDIINAYLVLQKRRTAVFIKEIQNTYKILEPVVGDKAKHFALLETERQIEEQANEFIYQKPEFVTRWAEKEEASKPPLPKVTYRQFIPGVPLVVPSELMTPEGVLITADSVYESIFHKYNQDFDHFVFEKLQVDPRANSREIADRIDNFMHEVERELDKALLPGDLSSVEGTKKVVEAIFYHFPHQDTFTISPEMASWLLWRNPPYNLITKLGYSNLNELLNDYAPNDVLALGGWSEEQLYTEQLWGLLRESVRVEHFEPSQIKPIVVSYESFPALLEMKESALNKFAGRILVSNLHKGMGGEFPKLRYFTAIAKNIIESERYGNIWQRFASEKKDFGEKVINSILGHWGNEPLSAHNIFESWNQRLFVSRLKEIAEKIAQEAKKNKDRVSLADNLRSVAESYHLSTTLSDGSFVPCSAWTWASYSFKGGAGLPTPLSLHVERDWTSREFLLEYYKAAGGNEKALDEKIIELMEQGMESVELSHVLLGGVKEANAVIVKQIITLEQKPAGTLTRFEGNPILRPISEHKWESRYVLNPGAISLKGKTYLIYRAVGQDNISRLGLAVSEDGFQFTERLENPIFAPKVKSEEKGCEDPRLTRIGDRIYMLYTAYGRVVAQIAMASIGVEDFLNYHWGAWHRHGLIFPGFTDKDGALFPKIFDRRFAILHRVEPHIWLTFTPHLRPPWPRGEHKILAGTRTGMTWDSLKIGAGAQPIKTKYGWLLITHGVDHTYVYRLGVMLLDIVNPTVLLYRSPNYILEPREKYEVGEGDNSWVPNVVFTCGAVPRDSKKLLEAEDELLVYYGAADSAISVGKAKIADLIPEDFRNGNNLKEVLKK
jgi:predicted GH43/DUF377 family glycosyl hydrolase